MGFLALFLASDTAEKSSEPPIDNKRVPISTLVREDVFCRLDGRRHGSIREGGEEPRPAARTATQVPGRGGRFGRAEPSSTARFWAHEAGDKEEFERQFTEAREHFAEAKELGPKRGVVCAVVGGSYSVFGDRLPEEYQEDAWSQSYDNYMTLWEQQGEFVDRLPLHIGGELLSGLAQAAQRTGQEEELDKFLDKIIEVYPDSQYAGVAEEWKEDPQAAATGTISCKYCHEEGRLEARLARFKK